MDVMVARGLKDIIIAEDVVSVLLWAISVCVGFIVWGFTLFVAFAVEEVENQSGWLKAGFFYGFIPGMMLSSILMGLVSGMVDTIIVLYAEAPEELALNHPVVSDEIGPTMVSWLGVDCNGI